MVAGAKQEGKLTFATLAGVGFGRWVQEFEKAFPGVKVEHQQFGSMVLHQRKLLDEQKAGVFAWDGFMAAAPITLNNLRPENALAPVRPLIIGRPDVIGDANWTGGFESGWVDNAKQLGYYVADEIPALLWINTDLVKEGEIRAVSDLLNPRWKGKIIAADPQQGGTFSPMHGLRMRQGEDTVKRLLIGQEVVFSKDTRQLAEAVVRGQYPIAMGFTNSVLQNFLEQGVGKNVVWLDIPDLTISTSSSILWLAARAPNPNAVKLFINWTLTKEGQASYSKHVELNSRRTDVPVYDATRVRKPGRVYVPLGPQEDSIAEVARTQAFLNDLMGLKS